MMLLHCRWRCGTRKGRKQEASAGHPLVTDEAEHNEHMAGLVQGNHFTLGNKQRSMTPSESENGAPLR